MRSEELFDTGRPKGCFSWTQHRMTSGSYTKNMEKKQSQFKETGGTCWVPLWKEIYDAIDMQSWLVNKNVHEEIVLLGNFEFYIIKADLYPV